jgi:hypothetical protein
MFPAQVVVPFCIDAPVALTKLLYPGQIADGWIPVNGVLAAMVFVPVSSSVNPPLPGPVAPVPPVKFIILHDDPAAPITPVICVMLISAPVPDPA